MKTGSAFAFYFQVVFNMPLDAVHNHVQSHQIFAALQNHQICKLFAGLHVLIVHGLYRSLILQKDRLHGAAALVHIPLNPAAQPDVGIVSTKILMSMRSSSALFSKIRIPSTIMTLFGTR